MTKESMKILLINPPFTIFTGFVNYYFPVGLGYLAAVLRDSGYEVAILDVDALKKGSDIDFSDEYRRLELYRNGLNDNHHKIWQDIKRTLVDYKPDLVGITAMTTKFGSVLKTAEVVKQYAVNCPIVVGGPHATLLPEQVLKSNNIDIVVRGEGEHSFLNLVNCLKEKGNLRTIKGISHKDNGKIIHNASQEFIQDLDEIPFPARELLMYPQNYTSEDMGAIMTSRGCPFNCTYCSRPLGKRVRNRSIENVIQEIKSVKEKYGTLQFEFKDDTFTVNRKRVLSLCEKLISDKIKINWSCTTRVDLLDEELIIKMKKAGCNGIKLGIETGSERILKETKKAVTFKQMREAVRLLSMHKIFWSGYFMIGLPTETKKDIFQTYQIMKELNPYYAGLGVYNPFPKTELFNEAVDMRLLHEEVDLDHFFKTNAKDYFFINPNKRLLNLDKNDFDKLITFMMQAFHKHNTKFNNIFRRGWARKRIYLNNWKLLFGDIKKVLKWLFA